jgi:hypothetical protein
LSRSAKPNSTERTITIVASIHKSVYYLPYINSTKMMSTTESSTLPTMDNENMSPNTAISNIHNDPAESFDEETEDELAGGVKQWDEGGVSDCGYNDTVHHTLMNVGETIHNVVGAPTSKNVLSLQKSIGNWFQELSYATRDLFNGGHESTLQKDAADVIHTVMTGGGIADDDDEVYENGEKKIDPYE